MKNTKTQIGRSMIEMLGVLAIVGVLSVGGLAGYARAMRTHKVNMASNYIDQVRQEIVARVTAGTFLPKGSSITCTALMENEPLPAGMNDCHCYEFAAGGEACWVQMDSLELTRELAERTNADRLVDLSTTTCTKSDFCSLCWSTNQNIGFNRPRIRKWM